MELQFDSLDILKVDLNTFVKFQPLNAGSISKQILLSNWHVLENKMIWIKLNENNFNFREYFNSLIICYSYMLFLDVYVLTLMI